MEKKWILKDIPDPETIQELSAQLSINTCLSTLLVQRGIDSYQKAEEYFSHSLSNTHSPFLMKGMQEAVTRFNQAIQNNERICIYGDYDVDGTTSVSLFINVIRKYYSNFEYYIPDRFTEGYGLNKNAVKEIAQHGCKLLFTLDCGIRSVEEIENAKSKGLDVIVCDHHEPGEDVPNCVVLNPKQIDCEYPFKDLCGCGVTFKFLQAVFETNDWDYQLLVQNTDLLTLAIGADIVSVIDENRIFCHEGLQQINQQQDTIIDLMFKKAKKEYPVTLTDVVFTIAPRINAAGRMEHAKKIVELFTATDLHDIQAKIDEIDQLNTTRKTIDRQVTEEAIIQINKGTQEFSNVVYQEDWAKGVLGIVASKLVEYNNRPSIVLTKSNGVLSGSGRSTPKINLFQILCQCEDELEQFGGHSFACGLSLKEENLNSFITRFEQQIKSVAEEIDTQPEQFIDLEIDFENIVQTTEIDKKGLSKFVRILQRMEPFGPQNMRPVFLTKNVYISDYRILKDAHVKLSFQQHGYPVRFDAIAFNYKEEFETIEKGKPVEILYSISINNWQGKQTVQFDLKGLRN